MRLHYVLEEGLPVPCQTGVGLDTVSSLQKAVKCLVLSKEVMACHASDIEVYLPGTTNLNYATKTPLKPDDKLPKGTSAKEYVFVHVPHDDLQELSPEERRLHNSSDRCLSMAVVPRPEEPPKQQRRSSMPTMIESKKTELPDYLKKKCYVKYGKQVIQVLMDPDEPCIHLKLQLEEATALLTMEQKFYYNGIDRPLKDDKSLRFYGLQAGGFFTLERDETVMEHTPRRPTFVAQATPFELNRQKERRNSVAEAEAANKRRTEKEAEAKRTQEEDRLAREAAAAAAKAQQAEADRLARDAAAAAAAKRKAEEDRLVKEADAKKKAEKERLAREAAAKLEADKKLAREAAAKEKLAKEVEARRRAEEDRLARQAAAKLEAERLAKEAEAKRQTEEDSRLARETETKRKAEEEWMARVAEEQRLAKQAEVDHKRKTEEAARVASEEEGRRKAAEEKEEAEARWARNQPRAKVENPSPNDVYDGMGLARGPGKYTAPEEADVKPKAPKTKRKSKKEEKKKDDDVDAAGWPRNNINHEFTPTPMDMSTFRCWYQLEGDIVPYYIRINGWEKAHDLKKHILATRRSGKNAALLDGIDDLSELKLIPPGVDISSGQELGPTETLPNGTSSDDPILVIVKEAKGVGRELTPIGGLDQYAPKLG